MPDHGLPESITVAPSAATPVAPPRRRVRAVLLLALLAGAVMAAAWYAAPGLRQALRPAVPPTAIVPAQPPAITVGLAPVRRMTLARPVIGDGSVAAWQELVIGTEIGGLRVIEVGFEEGDTVRKGQVLVRLDPAIPAAQAQQAEAAAEEAEAALRMAQSDLRRSIELSRTDNVARQILEQRQSAARQAEAKLAAAQARRDEAVARLAQTRIEAPADGVVSRRSVLLGAVVQPGQEMFRLIRDGRLELAARVPELDLAAIRPGQPVRVTHGERAIEGQVRMVAPVIAGDTRLGIVYVILPPDSGLRPGMFARAEVVPAATQVLAVPQEAVVFRGGTPIVFVVASGADRVAQRAVTPGARRDGMVEIASGLDAEDRVVVAGAGFLTDGDVVRVADAPARPGR
ncbi:MAG: efflux RND transporter periplasmic adaptor subunit [Acetobacteraceae bacterium]|nr:efflux RND transporter periplasmic adaptor subunit [Acetobacteraceae bacterium]